MRAGRPLGGFVGAKQGEKKSQLGSCGRSLGCFRDGDDVMVWRGWRDVWDGMGGRESAERGRRGRSALGELDW